MAWVDGVLSQEEQDTVEQLMQNSAINEKDMARIRQAIHSHQSFDQILQDGLLKEEDPRKQQMKRRLILFTAYELAKADGSISFAELALHERMATIMDVQEAELQEMRRLILLKSGINIHDRITVVQGEITQEPMDAIVSSTNSDLQPGRKLGPIRWPGNRNCVDTLIHQVAGPELKAECRELNGCEVGDAKLTKGYNLLAKRVIHTVAPTWKNDEAQARELLNQCYHNTLVVAFENSIEKIAFPALGTGEVPADQAAAVGIAAVRAFLNTHFTIKEVRFVCNDAHVYQQFVQALENEIGVLPMGETFTIITQNQKSHHDYETFRQAA